MTHKPDDIYASSLEQMVDFRFDERVVSVFPDMIQRSVPGYATLISNIGILAGQHVQAETNCYDLGCSLGAVSLSMQKHINEKSAHIVAVDNSSAMIDKAREVLKGADPAVELICADINDVVIQNASVVVMNFTLQFIPLEVRQSLINKIYLGLTDGGILILSEKVTHDDATHHAFHIDAHHNFKRANGYSDLEISQKRNALENVLIPETLPTHYQRLESAGFQFVDKWFQCFNFVSMVAVK